MDLCPPKHFAIANAKLCLFFIQLAMMSVFIRLVLHLVLVFSFSVIVIKMNTIFFGYLLKISVIDQK